MEEKKLTSRLRDKLEKVTVEYALPGIAIAVRREGREIFADGFGTRDADGLLPVTTDTMFGVASVTKFLTAVLIMQAQKQQLLKLSDPVSRFFPKLDHARDGQMRLHHLLTHSAGFPGLPFRHSATVLNDNSTSLNGAEPLITAHDLVDKINALNPYMLGLPGERHSYSNESYCLLGGIIEDLYRCSFVEAAQKFVFQPLQMERSTVGGLKLDREANLAAPLMRTKTGLHPCEFWEAPLFYPAGGLVISVNDMVRLISILDGEMPMLTQRQGLDMIANCVPVASRPFFKTKYGFGLEVEQLDTDNTLVWHTGQRPGISSFVGHVLEKNVTVALAVNLADVPTANTGHQVISEVLEGEIAPDSCIWPPPVGRFTGEQAERFCGYYGSLEMGEFHVHFHKGRLLLNLQSAECEFQFDGANNGMVGEYTFCFLSKNGNITTTEVPAELALDLRILPRL